LSKAPNVAPCVLEQRTMPLLCSGCMSPNACLADPQPAPDTRPRPPGPQGDATIGDAVHCRTGARCQALIWLWFGQHLHTEFVLGVMFELVAVQCPQEAHTVIISCKISGLLV
jgi:hypothetical protein